MVRAVLFDIGGVVVRSPLIAIAAYEQELGLPQNYLNVQITSRGRTGAWQRFERGEIAHILDFYADFGKELSDTAHGNPAYRAYLRKARLPSVRLPESNTVRVDGRELFGRMMRESATYDPVVVEAIRRIRQSGRFLLIAITNNFVAPYNALVELASSQPSSSAISSPSSPTSPTTITKASFNPLTELTFLSWQNSPVPPSLREMFDVFVDSSEVGVRKPERGIYEIALREGGVYLNNDKEKGEGGLKAEECVMLDDLGMNLKMAQEMGMRTIHVPIGGSLGAIKQLEEVLGIPLINAGDAEASSSVTVTAKL